MSPSQQPSSHNPTCLIKNRFAHRFVRALNNLNIKNRSPHDENQIYRRSHRVKIAAYAAMASVVGSKRAWSRAVLWKVRNRSRNQGLLVSSRRKRVDCKSKTSNDHHAKVSVVRRRNPNPKREDLDPFRYSGQELKLRKLVPGAATMDSCCLMDETADYIKCLAAQVEVMKTLVDFYTTT
ncbi:transcription factor IBH1-like [Cynara cardunculus var. scolymus]|uniref:IBH1-like N-terminal domain-containing protein n=1 Tax=Cynara cardunculus var. scolymus TaxID=59895 RepID=A0A103Y772_CYNCS|nr:transcription factor IBH1-like [Cynara cardunculus var. scolymus]KVI03785.1 hypothetical protein Ccrd_017927 [Cynara cardunculus var. scolymus]